MVEKHQKIYEVKILKFHWSIFFCGIKALLVWSDFCRVIECRIRVWQWSWEKWMSPEWTQRYRSCQGEPQCKRPSLHPSSCSDGHPIPRGDLKSASYSVEDVHQAQLHRALGDEDYVWRGQNRDRCQRSKYAKITCIIINFVFALLVVRKAMHTAVLICWKDTRAL